MGDFRNTNSVTNFSNNSTSAGGTMGLWKNSSKLMRDPDQIGNQMMANNNNSSGMFANNGISNNSGSAATGGKMDGNSKITQSNQLYGLSNFSPMKQNSEHVRQTGVTSNSNENIYGSH